jgi:tetratricopeptide (TPR) repeat protein
VSFEALERWEEALGRYLREIDEGGTDADLLLRAATCYYQLDRYPEAIELLDGLAGREDLSPADRIRARTYAGICKLELGQAAEAESDLRKALGLYRRSQEEERIDVSIPSQAQFFLGELYRDYFREAPLASVDDQEKLKDELEYKAQLLLSAQGHYLRTMRMGDPYWATAAGQRVGSLYEELYDEMMGGRTPEGLDEEQARMYHAMLRRKLRVLLQKAIAVYERTLATADRVGVSSAFVQTTKEGLDRMKALLLSEPEGDEDEDDPSVAGTGADD